MRQERITRKRRPRRKRPAVESPALSRVAAGPGKDLTDQADHLLARIDAVLRAGGEGER